MGSRTTDYMYMCVCMCPCVLVCFACLLGARTLRQHDVGMGTHLDNHEKVSLQTVDGLKNQTLGQDSKSMQQPRTPYFKVPGHVILLGGFELYCPVTWVLYHPGPNFEIWGWGF